MNACNDFRVALLLAVFLLGAVCGASTQIFSPKLTQYGHTAWRVKDGAFDGTPGPIAQTVDGYLWIGTSSGLVRFDGVRFTDWQDPKGNFIAGLGVDSLLGAKDGSLLIGGRTFTRLKNNEFTVIREHVGRINSMLEDKNGNIWLTRTRQMDRAGPLCRLSGDTFKCFGKSDGIDCTYGESLALSESGSLWIGSNPEVCVWDGQRAFGYLPEGLAPETNGDDVLDILTPRGSPVIVGYGKKGPKLGLEELQNGHWKPFSVAGLKGSEIAVTNLMVDRQGGLWIGTENQGLYRVFHGVADHYGESDGLSDDAIINIYEDREGSVWVATSGGLDRFHPLKVTTLSPRDGFLSNQIQSVAHISKSETVFAGRDGLSLLRNGKISNVDAQRGFPGKLGTSMFVDRKGTLWIGVDDQLTVFSDGKFRVLKTVDGAPPGQVTSITEDTDHTIWVFTASRGLFRFRGARLEKLAVSDFDVLDFVAPDPVHGIWLMKRNGDLVHYDSGSIVQSVKAGWEGFPPGYLTVDADGSVWVWGGRGILRWKSGIWSTLDSHHGLPCDVVTNFVRDGQGSRWINMTCGLAEVSDTELNKWADSPRGNLRFQRFFDAGDGARTEVPDFSPSAALGGDGRLWFASGDFLQMVDLEHLPVNTVPPPVHVESLIADRRTYPVREVVQLPARTRDVRIDYTALSLVEPHKVRFRYRLSGVDQDWQDVGDRRQAFYMNLRPGRYAFQVIACNNDGIWNMKGDQFSLVIPPAFYQTYWFYCLTAAVTFAILWVTFKLRIRAATERVESRLTERLVERDRIARELHDTLLQGFQILLLRLQAVAGVIPDALQARKMVQDAIERAEDVLVEGRERVRDLRSHEDHDEDLAGRISRLVEVLREPDGSSLTLSIVGQPCPTRALVAEEISLIGREAISNSLRHSGCRNVACELRFEQHCVVLVCQDDGIGIEEEALTEGKRGHWGLLGMRERARKIESVLKISSQKPGTCVELRVPARIIYVHSRRFVLPKISSFLAGIRK